jgi:hypothetical protein
MATAWWYHATAYYGERLRHWWNRRRDDIVSDVLVPFVGKQVLQLKRAGMPSLFNFGTASYLTILKTSDKLKPPSDRRTPTELGDRTFVESHNATEEFVNELRLVSSTLAARSVIERSLLPTLNQIFVIMKLGDTELDSAYEGVIAPLGKEFGYKVVRIDQIQDSGNITQQILENIAQSRLVLAELSGERPNCYYEAGFAHALGKEMIFASQHKYEIHFDLAGYRFIRWRTEADYRHQLRERLTSIQAKDSD